MTDHDYKDLELIEVKLPRKDIELLRAMLERESAYNWFTKKIKSYWVWIVSGGILTIWMLYDKVIEVVK